MFGGSDVLERRVDEALEGNLKVMDVDVELQEIPVKLILGEVHQVVWLALDIVHNVVEIFCHLLQPLDMRVLCQQRKRVNRAKHFH